MVICQNYVQFIPSIKNFFTRDNAIHQNTSKIHVTHIFTFTNILNIKVE